MMKTILVTVLVTLGGCTIVPDRSIEPMATGDPMDDYLRDLEAAIVAVERNYAGYSDKRERLGSHTIDKAAKHARVTVAQVKTPQDCHKVIHDWLGVFHDDHLSLITQDAGGKLFNYSWSLNPKNLNKGPRLPEPTGRILSDDTFLVAIPSFDLKYKARIDKLLKQSDPEIRRRTNLIIDLRGNGGGSDVSYSALSPYLYTQPIVCIGVDALATEDNAAAWEALLADIPEQEGETRSQILRIAKKMRAAPEGTFVSIVKDETITLPEVFPRPSRVGILIDRVCGSTTEQFLLEARQSKKVTLFGENSGGVLDYANVRIFPLPSGQRILGIPTTRSRRLPKDPVDNVGIIPDVRIENLNISEAESDRALDIIQQYWKSN